MEPVFGTIRHVVGQRSRVVVHGLSSEYPAHVCPPFSVPWRMRVALLVGETMVNTVGGHPEDRSAFKAQRAAYGQKILDPFGSSVAAMRQQPVIAHPDAQTPRYPPEPQSYEESFPSEKKSAAIAPP